MYFKSKKDPFIEGFPEMNLFKYLKIFLFFYPDILMYDASSPTKTKIVENTKSNLFWKYIEEKTNRTITRSEYHKLNNFDTDLSVPLTINGYTFDCTYPNGITSQSDLDKLLYNGVLYNGKSINGGTTSNLVTTLVSKNNDFLMNELLPNFQIKSIDIFNDLLKNQEGILDAKYVLNKNLALLVKKLSLSPNDSRTEYVFDPNVYKDYLSSNNIFSYVAPANVNGVGSDTSLFNPADTKLIPVEKVRLQIILFEGWRNLVNHLRKEDIEFTMIKSLFPLFYPSRFTSYSEYGDSFYNLSIDQVKEKMRVNLNPILKDKTPMIKEPIRDIKIPFREENWTIENQDAFDRLSVTWDDIPNYIYYADLKPYILEKYPENSIQYSQIYRNLYLRVADVSLPRYNAYNINLGMELRRSKSITNSEIVTLNVVYDCLFKWGHPKIGERQGTGGYVDSYVYNHNYNITYSNNVLGLNLGLTKSRIMDKRPLAGLFQIMRNGDKKEVTMEMWNLWEHSSFTFDLSLNLQSSVPGNSTYYNYNLLIPDLKSNNFYNDEVVDGMREKHKMLGTLNDFVTQFYGPDDLPMAINSYNGDKTFFNKWNGEISRWLKEHITTAGGAGELHKFLNDLIASAGSIDGWNRMNGTKQVREHVMQHYNRLHNNFIDPAFIPLIEEKDMEARARIEKAMMKLFSSINKGKINVAITPGMRHYLNDTLCTSSIQNNNLIINFNRRYIKWKADIYNKNDWNDYSHTLYVGLRISSNKESLDNYGFESEEELSKALEYYIRYGRIRVAAGTYTYELFKGNPRLETIKSFHSNGEIIPVNLVSLPYLTEFDKSSRNRYDDEKFSAVFSRSTFSKYINNPLVIKGGLYIIPTSSGRWEYRTINSIDDIPKNNYNQYDIYMVHLVNMFGEDGKNRDYDSFFTFTPDH